MISIHRALEHRARAVLALLVMACAALALGACGSSGGSSGGGGSGGGADAGSLLKATFSGAHKIKSGNANLQLTVNVQGSTSLNGPIKLALSGPFQSVGSGKLPQFDLAINAGAQGQSIQAGLTSTSDRLFVKFGGTAYEAPASLVAQLQRSMQQSSSSSSGKLDLGGLGIDPLNWLKNPTVKGTETAGGVQTQHITAQLDVSALLNDLDKLLAKVSQKGLGAAGQAVPRSLPAKTRAEIQDAIKHASIDVWTGTADKTLRKISLALAIAPKNTSSLKSADIALSLELNDLNKPQTITAPSSSRPLSELLGQFQGLLGGAGGGLLGGAGGSSSSGGGGTGGSGSAGGSSSQKKLDKYTKCLQDAGTDVQKAQGCASLLTK